jgi:hypothetical protein
LVPNRDDASFVEEDGPESLPEDFSNNIEYYLFEPETLRRKAPKIHDWIKKKFGDSFKLSKGG